MAALTDPTYRNQLNNGLVAHWATPADAEAIARLMGLVWRQQADDPINPRMVEMARRELAPRLSGQQRTIGPLSRMGSGRIARSSPAPPSGGTPGNTKASPFSSAGLNLAPPTPTTGAAA